MPPSQFRVFQQNSRGADLHNGVAELPQWVARRLSETSDNGASFAQQSTIEHGSSDRRPASSSEQEKVDRREASAGAKGNLGIRTRLQIANRARKLALINLAIDSELRASDLVSLCVCDVA